MIAMSRQKFMYLVAAEVGASPEHAAISTWSSLERAGLIERKLAYTGKRHPVHGGRMSIVIHHLTTKGKTALEKARKVPKQAAKRPKKAEIAARIAKIEAVARSVADELLRGMSPHEASAALLGALEAKDAN